jgi:hypothetical protein
MLWPMRETCVRRLCASEDLADTLIERSRDLYRFRNWFRSNESSLVSAGEGRFKLTQRAAKKEIPITTAASSQIWADLVPEVVDRLGETLEMNEGTAVVIMPVEDQTLAGLGERGSSILSALKGRVSQDLGVRLIDEGHFDTAFISQPGRRFFDPARHPPP